MSSRLGVLLLVSGPSGSGKSTLCRALADKGEARFSISCTTRPPRPGESHGREYYIHTADEFQREADAGNFLEHAVVHGNHYGTLMSEVLGVLEGGVDVVMDIDVQGAAQVRACDHPVIRRCLVDLFVMPADEHELRRRLAGRGTDSDEVIALRMRNALGEMQHWRSYSYCLVSGTRAADLLRFEALLLAERLRVSRLRAPS
jgi:guanylate kinase